MNTRREPGCDRLSLLSLCAAVVGTLAMGGCNARNVIGTVDAGATGGSRGTGGTPVAGSSGNVAGTTGSGGGTAGAGGGAPPAFTFTTARNYQPGLLPSWVSLGDLDGDGRPDLIVSGGTPNAATGNVYEPTTAVAVLLNGPNGTFTAPANYGLGPGPTALADMNGDGLLDAVVLSQTTDQPSVNIFLNTVGGRLASTPTSSIPAGGFKLMKIADVNGDGRPDVVGLGNVDGGVFVSLNKGQGAFAPVVMSAGSVVGLAFEVADIDGDGRMDLVVANRTLGVSGTVSILVGNGDGTFTVANTFPSGAIGLPALAVGDLNGDGRPDVVATESGDTSVLLNQGNGVLGTGVRYPLAGVAVALGDLNADGRPDLIGVGFLTGTVSVAMNQGAGTFATPVDYLSGMGGGSTGVQPVVLGDMNGDGSLDVVVGNPSAGDITVMLNRGNGTLVAPTALALTTSSIAVGDYNRDGKPDLAITGGSNPSGSGVSMILGRGDGTFAAPVGYPMGTSPAVVAAADLDDDGRTDLLMVNTTEGTVSVPRVDDSGSLGRVTAYPAGEAPTSIAIGDVSGDGKPDVVVASRSGGTVNALLNDGHGVLGAAISYPTGGIFPESVAIGDVNGDGQGDLVVAHGNSSDVGVLLNKGGGVFAPATTTPVGGYPRSVALGDMNGDGRPDVAVADGNNVGNMKAKVLVNMGGGMLAAPVGYAAGGVASPAVQVAFGDVNGDGRAGDLVILNRGGFSVLLNGVRTDGGFGAPVDFAAGAKLSAMATADFNNDGQLDLAVAGNSGVAVILGARR